MMARGAGELPADAVPTKAAAALLGLTTSRVQQLVRAGHATSPRRGYVNLISLLRGYVAFLRAETLKPASAAMARAHDAAARLVEARTQRRRAELVPTSEAAAVLSGIADIAIKNVRSLGAARSGPAKALPPEVKARLRAECEDAIQRIEATQSRVLLALTTGDLSEVEG
jgi:hypothetical protein